MRRFAKRIAAVSGAALAVLLLVSLWQSKYALTVTVYSVPAPMLTEELRLVQLTDLHGMEFGGNNARLTAEIRDQMPDMILMTGDMFNADADAEEIGRLCRLISELCDTAPVFYSLGNHEIQYIESYVDDVLRELEASGAVVLEQEYTDFAVKNQQLRIGGAYGYLLSTEYCDGPEQAFLRYFSDTELPTILLSHMSEGLLLYGGMEAWDVDLILSGHTHGGQIRMPLIGGLFSPETGWFPQYTRGIFEQGCSVLVLSAGLGTSEWIPRLNNPPELVVVNLVP